MNKSICVLEDSEEILEIITIVLEEEGYDIYGYGTISAFISSYENINPILCMLDVMLPDGNGLEVCHHIKSNLKTSRIPVVMMTANSQIEKMRETCQADDFVSKPFDIDDLSQRINKLANNNNFKIS